MTTPISTFEMSTSIGVSSKKLAEWHYRKEAVSLLIPPWEKVNILQPPEKIEDGSRAVMEVRIGPIKRKWVAEHRNCVPGERFTDIQIEGPFAHWEHHHFFESVAPRSSILTDRIEYRLPFGILGKLFAGPLVRHKLHRMFSYRHEVTKNALHENSATKEGTNS